MESVQDGVTLFSLIPLLHKPSAGPCKYGNPLRTKFHNDKGNVSALKFTLSGCLRFYERFYNWGSQDSPATLLRVFQSLDGHLA